MRLIKIAALLVLLGGLLVPFGESGLAETVPGPVPARVMRVIDGDTIVVRARIWLGQDIEIQVRFDGVDAPEMNGKCENERRLAIKARDFIVSLTAGGIVVLRQIHYGKYAGRVVARVLSPDDKDFSKALLQAGLGRLYNGRRRASWCYTKDQ